ncbi:hypothetical protein PUN28_000978 [Cardiocondyla obscurior]|uniref:Uncharacterized protein n=1 Tax=Cardiocondyla obscurior TaxID=286306 RepID=A0AAW2H2E2_9HYME
MRRCKLFNCDIKLRHKAYNPAHSRKYRRRENLTVLPSGSLRKLRKYLFIYETSEKKNCIANKTNKKKNNKTPLYTFYGWCARFSLASTHRAKCQSYFYEILIQFTLCSILAKYC